MPPIEASTRRRVLRVLDSVWPHVPLGIERAAGWGGRWFDVSTPFLEAVDAEPVAHVGVVDCQFVIGGAPLAVPALHAVCVREDQRGRGHGRRTIERALADLDARGAERVILWSEKVDFYRRFGFRPVREAVFTAEAPAPDPVAADALDLDRPDDLAVLQAAFAERRPVSDVAAAGDPGWHFLIALALWIEALQIRTDALLTAMPDDGVVLAAEVKAGCLRLYDVVGPLLPPVARLVGAATARFGEAIDAVEAWFVPDRLDVAFAPREHPEEEFLMVRGEPLFPSGAAATLSPLTRT